MTTCQSLPFPHSLDFAESNSRWMLWTIPVILEFSYLGHVDQRCKFVDQLIALDHGILDFGE